MVQNLNTMNLLIIDKPQSSGDFDSQGTYSLVRFNEELDKKGVPFDILCYKDIEVDNWEGAFQVRIAGNKLNNYSHILLRGHRTWLEYQLKHLIVAQCKKLGIKVQNGDFIHRCPYYNKLYQFEMLEEAGIPYPPTTYSLDIGQYENQKQDFLLKNLVYPFTRKGDKITKDILKIDAKESNLPEVRYPNPYLSQKYLNLKSDYRVIVNHGNPSVLIKREATESFITIKNGKYSSIPLDKADPRILSLATRTNDLFEADLSAIDIMGEESPEGIKFYVLEINMNPGFKAIETKTDFGARKVPNMAKLILDNLLDDEALD